MPRRIRVASWNMQGSRQRPMEGAQSLMRAAGADILVVQEPGRGMVDAARRQRAEEMVDRHRGRRAEQTAARVGQRREQAIQRQRVGLPARLTRANAAAAAFPVRASIVENDGERGGPVVVLSRDGDPTFQVQVTQLPVQDRNFARVTVTAGPEQFVLVSGHAPYGGGQEAHSFMHQAATAAAAAGADVLIGDTNLHGPANPRLQGWQETPVGGTTRSANPQPLDRVFASPNSRDIVSRAGRLFSHSGSSTRPRGMESGDVSLTLDAATQATYAASDHTPIFADLARAAAPDS